MGSTNNADKVIRPMLVLLAILQVLGAGATALLITAVTYCGLHFDGAATCDQNLQGTIAAGGISLLVVSFLAWFSVAVYRYRLARVVCALELLAAGGLSLWTYIQGAISWGAPVVSSDEVVPFAVTLFAVIALLTQIVPKRAVPPPGSSGPWH